MVFSSFEFVFGFLPLFLACYWLTPGIRARNVVLTLWSYAFYGWWRPDFVLLMLFSTLIDWWCSLRMGAIGERRKRTLWLVVSVCTNLGLLGWFKYANLVAHTLEALGAGGGDLGWQDVVLPVGISFFTFQSMSYTIDVWRGEVRPVRSILDLACYVSMFPQLVAGPIVRYRDVQAQLVARSTTLAAMSSGVVLFMIGLAKKVLIADNAALLADPAFDLAAPGLLQSWLGVSAYAVQIFFDFAGYSDMAVGLGLLIGFRFPKNFDSPYVSASITEFWRRWHISLSTWLRDYLYVPLGGNRRSELRTYFNLSLTMLLGGLWHGAAWTFVLWGAYQGLFLVIERLLGKKAPWGFLPRPLQVAVTFAIVLGGWAVFRAETMRELGAIWGGMAGLHGVGSLPTAHSNAPEAWTALMAGLLLAWFAPHSWTVTRRFRTAEVLCIALLFLVALGQLAARSYTPFIYFRF
ncbi:MAG: MBOAT family protein [Planctomycetes bacterium]|nr:MBOAT family protein [Planctomycetota bacterium]